MRARDRIELLPQTKGHRLKAAKACPRRIHWKIPVVNVKAKANRLSQKVKYGCEWPNSTPLQIEIFAIRKGGYWDVDGKRCGIGLFGHYKHLINVLWPGYEWHRWNELLLKVYLESKETVILGPASTGKSNFMAIMALVEFWISPENTSCLVSSTTMEGLERRILGEIKKYFSKARQIHPELPGCVLDGRHCIAAESIEDGDTRDIRNGIIGIACRSGGKDIGLGNYVGIKNGRVRLFADEGSYMSRAFVEGANNLDANTNFKMAVSGNPNDPTDSLGILAEPDPSEGGWEGVVQGEKTRTWKTRRAGGTCIQLVGTDSPNFDPPEGRYPYLIGRRKIEDTRKNYGDNTVDFNREAKGHMSVAGAKRRVITRSLCEKHQAFNEPVWNSSTKIKTVVGVDAAYSAIGGDRSVLTELAWGPGVDGRMIVAPKPPIVIPVLNIRGDPPEEQIARFIKEYCVSRGIPPEDMGFDGTGRSSLTSALARIWSPAVVAIEFGGAATDRPLGPIEKCSDRFDRFVTELWFAARHLVEHDQFRGMTEALLEEGQAREFVEKAGGKVAVLRKDQVKDALGKSPDLFDSLVTAVEMARRRGLLIAEGTRRAMTRTPDWMKAKIQKARSLVTTHQLVFNE